MVSQQKEQDLQNALRMHRYIVIDCPSRVTSERVSRQNMELQQKSPREIQRLNDVKVLMNPLWNSFYTQH